MHSLLTELWIRSYLFYISYSHLVCFSKPGEHRVTNTFSTDCLLKILIPLIFRFIVFCFGQNCRILLVKIVSFSFIWLDIHFFIIFVLWLYSLWTTTVGACCLLNKNPVFLSSYLLILDVWCKIFQCSVSCWVHHCTLWILWEPCFIYLLHIV